MTGLTALPLETLPLISLDLETTGLQTKSDRVVQIGLYDPHKKSDAIDQMVNPGIAIPAKSASIHGISTDMVADAPHFPQVLPSLRDAVNARVIIGYNIGFDLAILVAEAARHGLEWESPPAICVRQMASVALGRDAMLVMGTLEALAEYLGVATAKRHTAIGDARMTSDLFFALLPAVQEQGIHRFGDLLKATSALDGQRMAAANAGWVDVSALPDAPSISHTLKRIDPFPYSHRINAMMVSAPLIMPPDAKVLEAAAMMKQQKRECVFVGTSPDNVVGIVSERDIVHCMAQPMDEVSRAREMQLNAIMSAPLISVHDHDYMHVALGRMHKHDIRHLAVISGYGGDGRLLGYVSGRELNRLRLTEAMVIGDEIASADDTSQIAAAMKGLPQLAASLMDEAMKAYDIASVISGQYRAALARAALLAESKMRGKPPVAYCLLILGSGGREESLLAPDQDHAIIYAAPPQKADAAKTQKYFETLGQHIADILDTAGVPYCDGGVMSNSAKWCKSLDEWKTTITNWIERAKGEDVLYVDIFFDYASVHGADRLAEQLQTHINKTLIGQTGFLKMLAGNIHSYNAGSNFWGGFNTENGRFNIKRYLLLPLVETLRILAASRGVSARNSTERAQQLMATDTIPPEIIPLAEDLQFSLRLVLRQQIADINEGLPPTTQVELARLTPNEKRTLKSVQNRVKQLDQFLIDCLFG